MNPGAARLYVLDTSVLLHDPTALFRFQEHDIALPEEVLRELDRGKKGLTEEARNARQTSRFLDTLIDDASPEDLQVGLPLTNSLEGVSVSGRLYFLDMTVGTTARGDDTILASALKAAADRPAGAVTLVTKDINLRIRATVAGLHAEDYHSDQALEDVDLLYTGVRELAAAEVIVDADGERARIDEAAEASANEIVFTDDGGFAGRVHVDDEGGLTLRRLVDYQTGSGAVWGINARNREQNAALNLLMDDAVDFVTLLGPAGTGKTLLALAAGLTQCFDTGRYREILMTRATVAIGEDIGHLPGTEEEKMTPWMGALMDNLEVLGEPSEAGRWGQAATRELLQQRIKIRSLNFMRGRTFLDRYIILDEAQNLTPKQMKTLITRAGPGSKIVCLGNVAQIDTPYLTSTTSGLTYVVDRFRRWPHAGHLILSRGERSRLADFASGHL